MGAKRLGLKIEAKRLGGKRLGGNVLGPKRLVAILVKADTWLGRDLTKCVYEQMGKGITTTVPAWCVSAHASFVFKIDSRKTQCLLIALNKMQL